MTPLTAGSRARTYSASGFKGLQPVRRGLSVLFQGRACRLDLGEQRLLAQKLGAALGELLLQARPQLGIGGNQLGALGEQPFLAALQPLQRLSRVSEMRLLQLERLLCLRNALALARESSLQQPEALLHLRQLGLFLGKLAPRLLQAFARLLEFRLPGLCRFLQLGAVLLPGVLLRPQLGKLRFEALARISHEANFCFQPRHVGVGPIELALRGTERIARRVMVAAGLLELALDLPQPRHLRLELRGAALDLARVALGLGIGLVAAQQPQQVLFERPLGRKLVVAAGGPPPPFLPRRLGPPAPRRG